MLYRKQNSSSLAALQAGVAQGQSFAHQRMQQEDALRRTQQIDRDLEERRRARGVQEGFQAQQEQRAQTGFEQQQEARQAGALGLETPLDMLQSEMPMAWQSPGGRRLRESILEQARRGDVQGAQIALRTAADRQAQVKQRRQGMELGGKIERQIDAGGFDRDIPGPDGEMVSEPDEQSRAYWAERAEGLRSGSMAADEVEKEYAGLQRERIGRRFEHSRRLSRANQAKVRAEQAMTMPREQGGGQPLADAWMAVYELTRNPDSDLKDVDRRIGLLEEGKLERTLPDGSKRVYSVNSVEQDYAADVQRLREGEAMRAQLDQAKVESERGRAQAFRAQEALDSTKLEIAAIQAMITKDALGRTVLPPEAARRLAELIGGLRTPAPAPAPKSGGQTPTGANAKPTPNELDAAYTAFEVRYPGVKLKTIKPDDAQAIFTKAAELSQRLASLYPNDLPKVRKTMQQFVRDAYEGYGGKLSK